MASRTHEKNMMSRPITGFKDDGQFCVFDSQVCYNVNNEEKNWAQVFKHRLPLDDVLLAQSKLFAEEEQVLPRAQPKEAQVLPPLPAQAPRQPKTRVERKRKKGKKGKGKAKRRKVAYPRGEKRSKVVESDDEEEQTTTPLLNQCHYCCGTMSVKDTYVVTQPYFDENNKLQFNKLYSCPMCYSYETCHYCGFESDDFMCRSCREDWW